MKRSRFLKSIALGGALVPNINEGPAAQSGPFLRENKSKETLNRRSRHRRSGTRRLRGGFGRIAQWPVGDPDGGNGLDRRAGFAAGSTAGRASMDRNARRYEGLPRFPQCVRQYYMKNYPLTAEAKSRKNLNPGDGAVSRLCHEPRVAVAVLNDMLAHTKARAS
jgi:hypothetical protein